MIILAITVVLIASIMHGHQEYMENYRRRSELKEDAWKQQRERSGEEGRGGKWVNVSLVSA